MEMPASPRVLSANYMLTFSKLRIDSFYNRKIDKKKRNGRPEGLVGESPAVAEGALIYSNAKLAKNVSTAKILLTSCYRTRLLQRHSNYGRRHPDQTGNPASSRSLSTSSPFFTSIAMMAGFPPKVILEPFTSTLSLASIFTSWFSRYQLGPR